MENGVSLCEFYINNNFDMFCIQFFERQTRKYEGFECEAARHIGCCSSVIHASLSMHTEMILCSPTALTGNI